VITIEFMKLENPFNYSPLRDASALESYRRITIVHNKVNQYVMESALTLTFGSITIGAEAMDMSLSTRPNTIQNNLARAGYRAVAIGAGYLTAKTLQEFGED
jgi:hypothetical protein